MAEMPEPEALLEHRAFVRAVAKGLLKDDAAAEDVAQETLLAAMERPPQGRNVRGRLGAVARNLSLMARRGDRRRLDRERRAARPEAVAPADEALALLELQRKVVEAVRTLEEPYRTAIVLHYFHDLPLLQLAARLRVPKETARTRLRRGLEKLRARLDADHGGNRSWAPLLLVLAADPKKVSVAGVALMSAKTKLALAAVACILVTLLAVKWGGSGGQETPRAEVSRTTVPDAEPSPPPAPDLPAPVDFASVDRDRDLHGIVVDKGGAPIAGADLRAVLYPHRRVFTYDPARDEGSDGPRTRSASDGTFRLPLEPGQEVWLRVSAVGYASLKLAHRQAGERVRVQLSLPASLLVRVKDASGRPVGGAKTEVRCDRDFEIRHVVATDETGSARFHELPCDVGLLVRASHPEHGMPDWLTGVHAGDEAQITLPEGRLVTGRVTDRTGAPIAGARVGMNWDLDPEVRTDGQGRYKLNGWMGEDVGQAIYAAAEGYVPAAATVTAATVYDFVLERGLDVTGRVLGPQGEPVAGALLAAIGGFQSVHQTVEGLSRAHGVSDEAGRFRLGPLRSRGVHTLVVVAKGYGRCLLDFDPALTLLGDIVLPVPCCVEGRVVDSDGVAVPRVAVSVEGENVDRYRLGRLRGSQRDLAARREERYADDLGRFRFPDLAPGRYRVTAGPEGFAPVSESVVVESDLTELMLHLPAARSFSVWVTDEAGNPVPAAVIVAHESGTSQAETDGTGRAEVRVSGHIRRVYPPVPLIPSSPYQDAEPMSDVPDTATEARFVLTRWEELQGTVVDDAGQPVAEAIVDVSWGPEQWRRVTSNALGRFHAAVAPGTSVDVRVVGRNAPVPDYPGVFTEDRCLSGEVRGVAAGSRNVVVKAVATLYEAKFAVRVLAPDGTPLAGARVGYQPSPPGAKSVETGRDGVAVVENAATTEVTVWVFVDARVLGFVQPEPQKIVPAGQQIDMRCRSAVRVAGTVVDADGKPVPEARAVAISGQAAFSGRCDDVGRFEILVPVGLDFVDLQAYLDDPDHVRLQGWAKHRIADGEARIVIKPPD